jgi:hypothetical protein
MANEIRVNASIQVTNGALKSGINPGQFSVTQSVARGPSPGCVNVGTSEEVVSFAELATLGWLHITNLGPTNYVDFGPESAGAMVAAIRLKAGESAVLRLVPGVTYRAKAAVAACNVIFSGFND